VILAKDGVSVDLPSGWEGRAFVPSVPPPAINFPVLHAASFPLVPDDSSFGGRLAAVMGARDAMFAVVEYDPRLAGDALFRQSRLPISLAGTDLHPMALQVPRPGQGGLQRFFAESERAFCLYVILGSRGGGGARIAEVNRILSSIRVAPLARALPSNDGVW